MIEVLDMSSAEPQVMLVCPQCSYRRPVIEKISPEPIRLGCACGTRYLIESIEDDGAQVQYIIPMSSPRNLN